MRWSWVPHSYCVMECVPNQEALSGTFCFVLEELLLPEAAQRLDELAGTFVPVGPFPCGFRTTNKRYFGKEGHTNLYMDETLVCFQGPKNQNWLRPVWVVCSIFRFHHLQQSAFGEFDSHPLRLVTYRSLWWRSFSSPLSSSRRFSHSQFRSNCVSSLTIINFIIIILLSRKNSLL